MSDNNIMIKENGKSFKCECGCNVFHLGMKISEKSQVYICNACGISYIGDSK